MTTEDLIAYYQQLLIVQYSPLPRASATIAAFVAQVIADQIVSQVRAAFGFSTTIGIQPDTAKGVQLDAIASYRGVNREIVGFDVSRTYFQMPFYGQSDADTAPGFALYGQDPITWFWLTYGDANRPLYALTDDELCRITQFRAQLQSMLLSLENVDDLLFDFFGDNVALFENGDMYITYIDLISDPDTLFSVAAATNSLPRPAGVRMDVLRSETLTEFFGYQRYGEDINPTFVGFGIYGTPRSGSFVRYA